MELAPFIKDLAIILAIAGIAMIVCQQLRQPLVLGYLLAGIIIGPYTPPHLLISDLATIHIIAELGVIFLMFALGIEFSFHKLKRVGAPASITGTIEVFFMLLAGYGMGKVLGWSDMQSLFLGAALSISSTTIIVKTLNELELKKNAFAQLIFGILIIEDLLAILLLVGLSTLATTSSSGAATGLLLAALKLFLTVASWFIIGYYIIPIFFRTWLKKTSDEILLVVAVALCLGMATLAATLHYSAALGAFVMGSILAETNEANRIEHLIQPLRDIFAAVFFVSVGMLVDPLLIWHHLGLVLAITAFTIIAKFLFSFIGAWLSRQPLDTSLQVGMSMAQIGEFSFIIAGLGLALNILSDNFYPLIVAVSLITSFTTPYFIKLSLKLAQRL
jgi:CPA2 family monovalent cation:H+ antiporter-2